MNKQKQYVTIKGTKDGLTLHLDDRCSFTELLAELEEKLSTVANGDGPLVSVHVQLGFRHLHEEEQEQLRSLIRQKKNLVVETLHSQVMTVEQAERERRAESMVKLVRIVRSGQVIQVDGDLLLIGDVNPGATVLAGGNIYILGALKGIAHAGCYGNKEAVIVASQMVPQQLRIADNVSRSPDKFEEKHEMECAYIEEDQQIVVDRLQVLVNIRPQLRTFERGNFSG